MTTDQPDKVFLDAVPLAKITKHPDNPRHDVGDVTDLAASIKDHGVLEPLVVVPFDNLPDDAATGPRRKSVEYALIAGHRRLSAAREAKVKTVPVIVRHDLTARDAQVAAMVIENQHRADLSPLEEGEAYQLLLDITPGSNQAKVAQAVGMPKKRVSERVRLTKLGDTAKAAVHDGQITLVDALDLLAIESRHPDLAEKAALAAGTKDFKYELNRARNDADILDRYDDVRAQAEELGTPILDKAPGYTDDAPRKVTIATHGIDVDDSEGLTRDTALAAIGSAHADCPGAALYIPKTASAEYELGWVCTQFKTHHVPTRDEQAAERAARDAEWEKEQAAKEEARRAALTDEERAEEERAAAEKAKADQEHAERVAALNAAQATRRAHFMDVINQAEPALAKQALVDTCSGGSFSDGFYGETYLVGDPLAKELLGLTEDADADVFTAALRHLTIEQIALLLWFVNTRGLDDELTFSPWQRSRGLDNIDPEYVAVLTDRYGYQWSSIEIAEFNLDEHGHVRTDDHTEAGDAA